MIVYRYLNLVHGLEALQMGRWKLGRLNELNDPFDCNPTIDSNLPSGLEFSQKLLDFMSGKWGLLCFSRIIKDPVIWSHYAASHQGLALGLEFEDNDENILKVSYSNARPILNVLQISRAADKKEEAKKAIADGFTTKASSWSYECEHRIMVALEKCTMVGTHYYQDFPSGRLKEIILGARCPVTMDDVNRVVRGSVLKPREDFPQTIIIRKCKMNAASFDLDFETFTPKSNN